MFPRIIELRLIHPTLFFAISAKPQRTLRLILKFFALKIRPDSAPVHHLR
jgi:hypothetical protein